MRVTVVVRVVLIALLLAVIGACSGPRRASEEATATLVVPAISSSATLSAPTATITPTSPAAPSSTSTAAVPTATATVTPTPTPTEEPVATPTATPAPIPTPESQAIDLPDLDVHYRLDISELRLDDGYVRASETITIREFRSVVPDTIYLQVVPATYGFFTLDHITMAGEPIEPAHLNEGFTLALVLPDAASAPLEIAIAFQLSVGSEPTGWAGTMLDGGILRLGYWFPIISNDHGYSETLDPAYSASASFDVSVALDPGVSVAHTGEVTGQEALEDGRVRYSMQAENVRDFALILSPGYTVDESFTSNGIRVELYTVDTPLETRQNILVWAADAIEQLSALVGPYPYPTFRIADAGSTMPGGVEFPGLIYINPNYHPLERLIYHEVAHQWLYGIIGTRVLEDGWIGSSRSSAGRLSVSARFNLPRATRFSTDRLVLQRVRAGCAVVLRCHAHDGGGGILGRDASVVQRVPLRDRYRLGRAAELAAAQCHRSAAAVS
jgi:hypothetical protein